MHAHQPSRLPPAWRLYLAAGLVALAAYFVLPGARARDTLTALLSCGLCGAYLVGLWLHRPAYRPAWWLLTVAAANVGLGDLVRGVARAATPQPSPWLNLIYVSAFPLTLAAFGLITRRRARGHGRAATIDSAMVTLGVGLVVWVFIIAPYAGDVALPGAERVSGTLFPLLDILLCAVTVRLCLVPGRRPPAFFFLTAGLLLSLASSLLVPALTLQRAYATDSPAATLVNGILLLSYVCWGTCALHPSMRDLMEPQPPPAAPLGRARLALLAAAALVGPALLAVQAARGAPTHLPVVLGGSVILFLLTLWRLADVSAALRAGEARLAEAQRMAHLGSWEYDLRTGALAWSDETYRLLGHAPRAFAPTYDHFLAQVYPDDRAALEGAVAAAVAAGAGYDQEFRLVRPDGSTRTVHATGAIVADADGRPQGMVGTVLDITARRAAEAARRASEARFRALVQRATDAVAITDAAGTIRYQSPAAERILGRAADEMVGTNALTIAHPDDLPAARQALGALLATPGASITVEPRVIHPDGTVRWVEATGSNLLDEPAVAGIVVNFRDITARKAAEVVLRDREARLAEAQRIAHLGSWEYDLARDELRWSDEVFRIGGLAPQSFVPTPQDMVAAVHPDDRPLVQAALAASLERGEPYDLDHRIVRPDGEIRVVHQQAEIVRDAAGRPLKRIGVVQDVTERRALEARLEHQAFHDPLTGLPNRALFLDRLDHALTRARRDGQASAVLFLDLDRFKDVNDSLGHDAGDRLLTAVAARLRRCLREGDTLARLGGDEFTVLLEDIADGGAAARLAERLAHALDAPIPLAGHDHRVTASIGIVLAGGDYARAEEVLRDADVAMYRAKAAGKARYAVFDPAMQAAVQARLALEQELRRALERGEFALHYQPIVDLQTGRTVKVEALVRWQHPERGLVPPGAFLPVAEEAGLIRPLGRWVLREACRQARAWRDTGHELTVAVNLTAQEFQGPGLVDEVATALREVGLEPRLLALEITEGAAMGDAAATVATLEALRVLGVGVAIDDFGTGYSSLAYLQRFPVDALKVDKAFVDGLGGPREDTAIVEAVVTLARALGLGVVAEGVETAAQAARLAALGCALGQGYHFARPLPPDAIPALLDRRWPAEGRLPVLAD